MTPSDFAPVEVMPVAEGMTSVAVMRLDDGPVDLITLHPSTGTVSTLRGLRLF